MALSVDQRERYARHLLLAELGDAGQQALCRTHVCFAPGADPEVLRTARDYLLRAGVADVSVTGSQLHPQDVRTAASSEDVRRLAGRPELEPAAAALLGAFEAVEALKQHAGVGTPGLFPDDLTLSEEEP